MRGLFRVVPSIAGLVWAANAQAALTDTRQLHSFDRLTMLPSKVEQGDSAYQLDHFRFQIGDWMQDNGSGGYPADYSDDDRIEESWDGPPPE